VELAENSKLGDAKTSDDVKIEYSAKTGKKNKKLNDERRTSFLR
jgi:hypothetical protein